MSGDDFKHGYEVGARDMREAAAKEADRDTDENGSVWIRPYHEIAQAIRDLTLPEIKP